MGASDDEGSVRLRAAMGLGTRPDPAVVDTVVERCATEPDFFVRDMLTWALTRLPPDLTLPRLRRELAAARAQARSQALHTLSKVGDRRAWAWIGREHLRDADDEVARAAWRAAVALVPEEDEPGLAAELVGQLGRGALDVRRSLSRALVELGPAAEPPGRRRDAQHGCRGLGARARHPGAAGGRRAEVSARC